MKSKKIQIFGEVQGVGFRYFTQKEALKAGILGWVKNCPDGSVLILAQGEDDPIKSFISQVKIGPGFSEVRHIEIVDSETEQIFRAYKIKQ